MAVFSNPILNLHQYLILIFHLLPLNNIQIWNHLLRCKPLQINSLTHQVLGKLIRTKMHSNLLKIHRKRWQGQHVKILHFKNHWLRIMVIKLLKMSHKHHQEVRLPLKNFWTLILVIIKIRKGKDILHEIYRPILLLLKAATKINMDIKLLLIHYSNIYLRIKLAHSQYWLSKM